MIEATAAKRTAFADESGIDGASKCYAIGVVSVESAHLRAFEKVFFESKVRHGVKGEVRWKRVDKSHGLINLSLEWLHNILHSRTARFDAIVVDTRQYRNWQERRGNREVAFYKTYTYLLRHLVKEVRQTTQVFIDDRSDAYPKHDQAVATIGNHMLARLQASGRLSDVKKVKSHETPGVQVADILTGAVAAAHRLHLDPQSQVNQGKRLAIRRMAEYLGWDQLHYDTLPTARFNIWHFPREYRGVPATMRLSPKDEPVFVSPSDMPA